MYITTQPHITIYYHQEGRKLVTLLVTIFSKGLLQRVKMDREELEF